jgi:hypothetical protein
VQVKAWVRGEPPLDLGSLVGRAVIEHKVHVQVLGDLPVDRDKELVDSIAR